MRALLLDETLWELTRGATTACPLSVPLGIRDVQDVKAELTRKPSDGKSLRVFPIRDVQPIWPAERGGGGVADGLVTELPCPESLGRHTAVAVATAVVRADVAEDLRCLATEAVRVLSSEFGFPPPLSADESFPFLTLVRNSTLTRLDMIRKINCGR